MRTDVSAAEMKEALKMLASLWGEVNVVRFTEGDFDMFSWDVTFASNVDNLANFMVVILCEDVVSGANAANEVEECHSVYNVVSGVVRSAKLEYL